MQRYWKFWVAFLAGLAVAIPSLTAASQDGNVSTQEWLTALGLFLPAIVVALAPANKLTTGDLVDQVNKNPDLDITAAVQPLNLAGQRSVQARISNDPNIKPLA
jgi:hypothetical protein